MTVNKELHWDHQWMVGTSLEVYLATCGLWVLTDSKSTYIAGHYYLILTNPLITIMSQPRDSTSRTRNTAYVPPPPPPLSAPHSSPQLKPAASRVGDNAFIKRYQTEVAASASSCLSTFLAVGSLDWENQKNKKRSNVLTQFVPTVPVRLD